MARLKSAGPILDAAATWRDRCLIEDGSVFSSDQIWTAPNLSELDRYFVQNLDYGEGDFWSKLETQLSAASAGAKKLAAEMFWVMYLMVSERAMGAETKRLQIRTVWRWSGDELSEDHPLLGELLSQGVSHPGTAYNTHRWREFRFFVTMLADWKKFVRDQRERLMREPWEYAKWLREREHAPGRQLRHVLLFLLFPDQFERIATASHKRLIVKVFRSKWGQEQEDFPYGDYMALDRELLLVRERLSDEEEGEEDGEIDFYQERIAKIWRPGKVPRGSDPSTKWPSDTEARAWLQEHHGDSSVWLLSVPGGGRLWRDFREGEFVAIGWDYLGDLSEYADREDIHKVISEQEGRENPTVDALAVWQFVREMKIGDIVIPKKGNSRLFGWGVVTGEYTYEPARAEYQHIRAVEWKDVGEWNLVGDQRGIASKTLTEFRKYPVWTKWALAMMQAGGSGADGSGGVGEDIKEGVGLEDLFLDQEESTAILNSLGRRKNVILQGPPGVGKSFMARRLAYALIGRRDPERVQMVQFHQSYAYEDFIQGWRPNAQGGFLLRDGVFHRFCKRAGADSAKEPFVFIIDEINRGNLSRIFGELMLLIESDKRGPDYAIPLTYSGDEPFFVGCGSFATTDRAPEGEGKGELDMHAVDYSSGERRAAAGSVIDGI